MFLAVKAKEIVSLFLFPGILEDLVPWVGLCSVIAPPGSSAP